MLKKITNTDITSGIYLIDNKINNKKYIGQSTNLYRRMLEHQRRTEQYIDKAIQKYGVDSFNFFVVEYLPVDELDQAEQKWIKHYNSISPAGYNIVLKTGLNYGENNSQSKLTEKDVIFIREKYYNKEYDFSSEIWREFFPHLSQGTIENVFHWRTWNHILPEYNTSDLREYYKSKQVHTGYRQRGEDSPTSILTEEEVIRIRILYETLTFKELSVKMNCNERVIKSIIYGQNWKHLPIYKKREKIWVYPKEWSDKMKQDFIAKKEVVSNVNE